MRAVTVYRLDDSSNFSYHSRHPIGSVWGKDFIRRYKGK